MEEVKKRETKKEIEIDNRIFVVTKYNPMIGNYILYKIVSSALPFNITEQLGFGVKPTSTMTKEDFLDLERDILKTCYEKLPAGEQPVLIDNDNFGISNFDIFTCLKLVLSSLVFNFENFFDVSQLTLEEMKL